MSIPHEECHAFHLTEKHWIALGTMIAFLCGVFALGGWLLADRTGVTVDAITL